MRWLEASGEEEGRKVPVVSVKGTTGHTLGAAGAVEAIVTALSVANECVPPTTGFAQPDPDCPVNVLTEAKTGYPQKVALSNSLGFGGHNAVLAISVPPRRSANPPIQRWRFRAPFGGP